MGVSHVLVKFQCFIFLLLWLQVASAEISANATRPITIPGCPDYNARIASSCMVNLSTVFISTDCSDKGKNKNSNADLVKFTFSDTKNKFIAIGCDTWAYLGQGNQQFIGTGCISVCNTEQDITDGSCNGIGCCKASIPAGLTIYNATVESMNGTRRNLDFNPCSYAFVVEESWFKFSSSYLKDFQKSGSIEVPVVIDWTIGYDTCEAAVTVCGPNANCTSSNNPPDINECEDIKLYDHERCERPGNFCNNTEGAYTCPCREGYDSLNKNKAIWDCFLLPQNQTENPYQYQQRNSDSSKIVF
ncbi:hypothetical protein MKW94_001060, partial [Papaver nudicaule]|nr:hypothetical protein [Papaver nudicaule]